MKYLYIENAQVTDALIPEATPILASISKNSVLVDGSFNPHVGNIVRIFNSADNDGVYLIKEVNAIAINDDFIYNITLFGNKEISINENKEGTYIGSIVLVQEARAPKDHVKLPQLAVKYHKLDGVQDFPQEHDPRFNLVAENDEGSLYYSTLEIDVPKNDLSVLKNLNYIYRNGCEVVALSVYEEGYVAYHVNITEVVETSTHYTYICKLIEPEINLQTPLYN